MEPAGLRGGVKWVAEVLAQLPLLPTSSMTEGQVDRMWVPSDGWSASISSRRRLGRILSWERR